MRGFLVARYARLRKEIALLEAKIAEQGDTPETRKELARLLAEIRSVREELRK